MAECAQCRTAIPAGARFCPACAAPVGVAAPSEERKLATVLFADLAGSTALAGAEDPERTRARMNRFYDAMAAEIECAGGTVEKFVGDAVMAAFGAPAAQEDHAERALHAALAMQRRVAELFGERLSLRIGVNTGEVVVGRPREGSSFATGDAVNVGARLEQAAAPGEILVGERTVTSVRGAFEFKEPKTVTAKGKPGGIPCRVLVRALSLMRPRGVGGLRRAFVGREAELEQLRAVYRKVAKSGEPQLLTLVGDAGVGKTRLLRELWEWLASCSPEPLRRTGRCQSYGQGNTYGPLAEVLKEHFGILESDSPDAVARALADRPLLGLTLGLGRTENLHPLAVRERIHDSWVEFMEDLSRQRPTVLLIEDLHWAEDDLCDLLETLVRQVHAPLLVLATGRPELRNRRPAWGRARGDASHLVLEALPPVRTGELLDELLGVEAPASVRQLIVERAEGNPFFVEELIATLADTGVLKRQDGAWSFGELPAGFSIPDSVQAVLAARIDLLPAAEKAALQAASVIGRVFWTGPVCELVGGGAPDFGLLEEREFIRRRQSSSLAGEREYVIKHALTREVAYSTLPKATRAHRHAAFASWLERRGEGRDAHAPLLAHHFADAVRAEDLDLAWLNQDEQVEALRRKAIHWSRRAADLAVGRYEIDEGLSLLHRALELESDRGRQAELWHAIGHANALKFDGPAFQAAMEKAIELGGPAVELYTELALQSVRRLGMWTRPPDPALIDGWVERALELSPEGAPTHAKALAAFALRKKDEPAARALQAIAERLDDVELRSFALAALTDVAWKAEDIDRARAFNAERIDLHTRVSDPDGRHWALMGAVNIELAGGRIQAARRNSALLSEMVEGLTPHHRLHAASSHCHAEQLSGRWDELHRLTPQFERTVEANAATPCPGNVSVLLQCAIACVYKGDDAAARRIEARAYAIGMQGFRDRIEPPRLRLALVRNDLAEVRRLVDSMAPVASTAWGFGGAPALLDALIALRDYARIESDAPAWLRPGTYAEPFAIRALAVARNDERLLRDAAARFAAMDLDWHAAETQKLLS